MQRVAIWVAGSEATGSPPAPADTAYLVPSCSPHSSVSLIRWFKSSRALHFIQTFKSGSEVQVDRFGAPGGDATSEEIAIFSPDGALQQK